MKKRTAGLLLALSLALVLSGCGDSGALKPEEQQEAGEQREIEEQQETGEQKEAEEQQEIKQEQKSDAEVKQDKDSGSEIVQENEEQKDGENQETASEPPLETAAETEQETEQEAEETGYYGGILNKVGYVGDKTYTVEEYVEVLTKVSEALGKTYNPDLLQEFKGTEENGERYRSLTIAGKNTFEGYSIEQISCVFDFSDHEQTRQNTYGFMDYLEFGKDATGNIEEFCIQSDTKEGEVIISMLLKDLIENQ